MADTGLGDLIILVGADLSALEESFAKVPAAAADVAAQVNAAFSQAGSVDALTTGVQHLEETLGSLTTSTTDVYGALSELAGTTDAANAAVNELTSAAAEAGSAASNTLTPALNSVHESASESESAIGAMGEKLMQLVEAYAVVEVLKEFSTEALDAYGNVQKAEISLTALTGSVATATETIEGLKNVALADALSFPSLVAAAQRMTALGFSTDQMNQSLQTAADTAAATGSSFDRVTQALDRMALSGTASGRMLATLGISTQDLANAMNVSADQVSSAFKAMDQSERLDALNAALNKFQGVAQQVAQGISGQWQDFKTQWDFILEDVGAALAPVATDLLNFTKTDILPFLQGAVNAFNALPGPMKDVTVAAVALTAAASAMWLAIGGPASLAMAGAAATALIALKEWKTMSQDLSDVSHTLTGNFGDMDAAVEKSVAGFQAHNDAITKSIQSFVNAHTPINQVAADYNTLQKNLADAQTNLANVKTNLDNGTASQGQYEAAVKAVDAAQKALNPDYITSADALKEIDTANKALNSSAGTLTSLLTAEKPAVMSVADAQASLATAQTNAHDAAVNLVAAQLQMSAAIALGVSGTAQQKTAQEALTAAEGQAKDAKTALTAAQKAVTDAEKEETTVANAIAAAENTLASGIKALNIPVLESYADAQANVTAKQKDLQAANDAVTAAITNLNNVMKESPGDADAIANATEALKQAQDDDKQATQDLNTAQKDLTTTQNLLKSSNAELLAGQQAIAALYKGDLAPAMGTLQTALDDLNASRQVELDDAAALQDAEANLKDVLDSGTATEQDLKTATDAATTARQNLKQATDDLNTSEANITTTFGLNKTQIDVLSGAVVNLQSVYHDLGVKSTSELQSLATAAQKEYQIIADSGTASANQQRDALIKALKDEQDAMVAAGGNLSKDQQDTLDKMQAQQILWNAQQKTNTQDWYTDWANAVVGINNALNKDLASGLAGVITGTTTVSKAFEKLGSDILSQITDVIVKQALKPLESFLTGEFTQVFSGLQTTISGCFGAVKDGAGMATTAFEGMKGPMDAVTQSAEQLSQGIGQAAGGGAGMMGSLANLAMSVMSMVSMVADVIQAVAGVISAVEQAHTNTLLTRIEESTRYTKIWTGEQDQSILWSTQTTAARLLDLINWVSAIRWDVAAIAGAVQGSTGTNAVPDFQLQSLQKLDYIGGQLEDIKEHTWGIDAALTQMAGGNTQNAQDVNLNQDSATALATIATDSGYLVTGLQNINLSIQGTNNYLQELITMAGGSTSTAAASPAGLNALAQYIGSQFSTLEGWLGAIFKPLLTAQGGQALAVPPTAPALPSLPSGSSGTTAVALRDQALDAAAADIDKQVTAMAADLDKITAQIASFATMVAANSQDMLMRETAMSAQFDQMLTEDGYLVTGLQNINLTGQVSNNLLQQMLLVFQKIAAPSGGTAPSGVTPGGITLNLTHNFNAPVMGGPAGMQQLTQTVGDNLVARLRQAGVKFAS